MFVAYDWVGYVQSLVMFVAFDWVGYVQSLVMFVAFWKKILRGY